MKTKIQRAVKMCAVAIRIKCILDDSREMAAYLSRIKSNNFGLEFSCFHIAYRMKLSLHFSTKMRLFRFAWCDRFLLKTSNLKWHKYKLNIET